MGREAGRGDEGRVGLRRLSSGGAPRGVGCGYKLGWGPRAERAVGSAWVNNMGPQHTCVFAQKDLK